MPEFYISTFGKQLNLNFILQHKMPEPNPRESTKEKLNKMRKQKQQNKIKQMGNNINTETGGMVFICDAFFLRILSLLYTKEMKKTGVKRK